MKVSVIDLGFNSVKLVNYDIKKDGTFKAYQQEGVKVKLGEGLHKLGFLGKEPMERTIDALLMFRDIIDFDSIRHVLPVATSAVREARNKQDFLKKIYTQTGFQFKVLSGEEEGLYSYIGALQSTCIPTSLFFDLGGGSLELVYTENYGIRKIKSYPLGALRLTQLFGRKNGTFSKKDYSSMEEHIFDSLPDRKELGLGPDTTLVGVGGTLRAMARYDQQLREYELDKVHNYRIDYQSATSISQEFNAMDADELSEIKAIGNNRIDTVTAGSAIIKTLMEKLDFEKVVVSSEGLREGILSVFVRDSKMFYRGDISNEKAKAFVAFSCQAEMLPQCTMTFIRPLTSAGLLREKEKMILTHAIKQAAQLPPVTNLNNLFYMMMDEDSAFLSHREQLILALSIVHTKKEKAADWLFSRYRSILEPQNKESIEKISACLVLSAILEKAKASTKLSIRGKNVEMKIFPLPRQFIPSILLKNAIKNFERAFDVSIGFSIESVNQNMSKEKIIA